ncbi:glycine zipper family protein [Psychroserpens damuponensis]|uniref:glycine zipper family protein n=1 Tax=Psychroserpens damuponensis TaxID=943936 RepID=UPI001269BF94|nr:glycine zipper family protein [Psychroserpens damuponensis]
MNTIENRQSIQKLFKDEKLLRTEVEKFKNSNNFSRSTIEDADLNVLIEDYRTCSECATDYKDLLEPFLLEIIDTNDDQVINKIEEYEILVDNADMTEVNKENLRFLLFSFKEASNYVLTSDAFINQTNRDNSPGKNIGRGLAWGFLAGCAQGAFVGATIGTVTVPVIGTVTGAVAGCIASGAAAGTVGAVGAAVWSFVDSIF